MGFATLIIVGSTDCASTVRKSCCPIAGVYAAMVSRNATLAKGFIRSSLSRLIAPRTITVCNR